MKTVLYVSYVYIHSIMQSPLEACGSSDGTLADHEMIGSFCGSTRIIFFILFHPLRPFLVNHG